MGTYNLPPNEGASHLRVKKRVEDSERRIKEDKNTGTYRRLRDVNTAGLKGGDVMVYNGTTYKWEPGTAGGGARFATIVVSGGATSAAGKAGADYVCTGTGDAATIQAALDEAASADREGGKVVLLEGFYKLGAVVKVPYGCHLAGMGHSTVLAGSGTAHPLIACDYSFGFTTDTKVSDLHLAGGDIYSGIHIIGASTHNQVRNCGFYNLTTGVRVEGDVCSVNDSKFQGCGTGVTVVAPAQVFVDRNVFGQCVTNVDGSFIGYNITAA